MTESPVQLLPQEQTLDGTLGLTIDDATDELAHGHVEVTDRVRQPYGIVHGGVFAALAESLVSATTAVHVMGEGMIAVGQSNNTTFMRPVGEGTLRAEARRRHRGRTTWVWDVDLTDDDGRVCAVSRITMAVRPPPGS